MIGKNKKMDYLLRGARGSFVRSLVEWFLQKNSMFNLFCLSSIIIKGSRLFFKKEELVLSWILIVVIS